MHDDGAEPRGDRGRAVRGPVVDDDGPVAGRHAAQDPRQRRGLVEHGEHDVGLDLRGNAIVPPGRDLPVLLGWPTRPNWLFALTQGLHTTVGLAVVPVLLAKLWSVIPRLYAWPPLATPAQTVERAALALLVGSAWFELATGVANMQ